MSFFDTYGPYLVSITSDRKIGSQVDLWSQVSLRQPEDGGVSLEKAIGCYVFGIRSRHKIRPWYVGMTVATAGFKGEVFQKHKIDIYNESLGKQGGSPVIFLLPLVSEEKYKFSKNRSANKHMIQWLEKSLMGFAFRQNSEIANLRDMKYLKNVEVLGLLGKRRGRPFREAAAIRQTLLGV